MVADGVSGANQLAELGKRFKEAGNGDLRKELLAGIRTSVKKMIPAVQQGARDHLPRSGGLADKLASQKFAARTSLASGKVSLTGSGMKSMSDIDAGKVRHPVFGDRNVWKQQAVTPGFFSHPIEIRLPQLRAEVDQVMSETAKKLEERL